MKVMQIARGLNDALLTGEIVRFDEQGKRIEGKAQQSQL